MPFVQFLFESRFRLNEAFGLRWQNVNLVTDVLAVRHCHVLGKDKAPKTEGSIRDVEITPGMMDALKQQKRLSYLAGEYVYRAPVGHVLQRPSGQSVMWRSRRA